MASRSLRHLTVNFSGKVRREKYQGHDYLVAPMVLINPGVLNGSKGALLYPPDEVAKNPQQWNGMPIVVYHPHRLGHPVSASTPGILDSQGVGVVRNAVSNGKLRAEGWFDAAKTQRVNPVVYQRLLKNEPIEISTGLYTDNEEKSGIFNGRQYQAIARNYRPDHLAILPDQVGACSVNDGCGVLINSDSIQQKLNALLGNVWSDEARQAALETRRTNLDSSSTVDEEQASVLSAINHRDPTIAKRQLQEVLKGKPSAEAYKVASLLKDRASKQPEARSRIRIASLAKVAIDYALTMAARERATTNRGHGMQLQDKLASLLLNDDQGSQSSPAMIVGGKRAGSKLEALFEQERSGCDMEKNCDQPLSNRLAVLLSNTDDGRDVVKLKTDNPRQDATAEDAEDHDMINGKAGSSSKKVRVGKNGADQDQLDEVEEENCDTVQNLDQKLATLVGNAFPPPQGSPQNPPRPPQQQLPPSPPRQAIAPVDPADWLIKQMNLLLAKFQEMSSKKPVENAWSDEAREAALEARRAKSSGGKSQEISSKTSTPQGIRERLKIAAIRLTPASRAAFALSDKAETPQEHDAAALAHKNVYERTGNENLFAAHQKAESYHKNHGTRGKSTHNQVGGPTMADVKLTSDERKAVVDGLIANTECCWEESDREVLNGLADVTLAKLHKQAELVKNISVPEELQEDDGKDVDVEEEPTKKGASQAEGKEKPVGETDPKMKMNQQSPLSAQDRADLAFARRYRMEQRQQHVKAITTNVNNKFTAKQLEVMDDAVLANMAALAQEPTEDAIAGQVFRPSFFGQQGAMAVNANVENEEPMILDRINYKELAANKRN